MISGAIVAAWVQIPPPALSKDTGGKERAQILLDYLVLKFYDYGTALYGSVIYLESNLTSGLSSISNRYP